MPTIFLYFLVGFAYFLAVISYAACLVGSGRMSSKEASYKALYHIPLFLAAVFAVGWALANLATYLATFRAS